jgi:hypothetical protein
MEGCKAEAEGSSKIRLIYNRNTNKYTQLSVFQETARGKWILYHEVPHVVKKVYDNGRLLIQSIHPPFVQRIIRPNVFGLLLRYQSSYPYQFQEVPVQEEHVLFGLYWHPLVQTDKTFLVKQPGKGWSLFADHVETGTTLASVPALIEQARAQNMSPEQMGELYGFMVCKDKESLPTTIRHIYDMYSWQVGEVHIMPYYKKTVCIESINLEDGSVELSYHQRIHWYVNATFFLVNEAAKNQRVLPPNYEYVYNTPKELAIMDYIDEVPNLCVTPDGEFQVMGNVHGLELKTSYGFGNWPRSYLPSTVSKPTIKAWMACRNNSEISYERCPDCGLIVPCLQCFCGPRKQNCLACRLSKDDAYIQPSGNWLTGNGHTSRCVACHSKLVGDFA